MTAEKCRPMGVGKDSAVVLLMTLSNADRFSQLCEHHSAVNLYSRHLTNVTVVSVISASFSYSSCAASDVLSMTTRPLLSIVFVASRVACCGRLLIDILTEKTFLTMLPIKTSLILIKDSLFYHQV